VRFGIFYEHQLPRPWHEDSERQLIHDALEQVELADKLGIEYVWEVEHHFLEEYSHSSAPEVFLAACSQRTQNMRLGHGIVQTPPPFNHPARVAERIATLDLVSNGRVEFGTGESSSEAELGGFNIDPVLKREMWQEGLEVAVRCMTEVPFTGADGKFVQMPPRNVVPKPVQKPHPPIHIGGESEAALRRVAQFGQGWYGFSVAPEDVGGRLARLEELLDAEGRTRSEIEVSICPYLLGADAEKIKRYEDAGVDQVILLALGFDIPGLEAELDKLATMAGL